jgi:hypothetical protein
VGFLPFLGLFSGSVKPAKQNQFHRQRDDYDNDEDSDERLCLTGIHDISIFLMVIKKPPGKTTIHLA